jgi:hypothetical protein
VAGSTFFYVFIYKAGQEPDFGRRFDLLTHGTCFGEKKKMMMMKKKTLVLQPIDQLGFVCAVQEEGHGGEKCQ